MIRQDQYGQFFKLATWRLHLQFPLGYTTKKHTHSSHINFQFNSRSLIAFLAGWRWCVGCDAGGVLPLPCVSVVGLFVCDSTTSTLPRRATPMQWARQLEFIFIDWVAVAATRLLCEPSFSVCVLFGARSVLGRFVRSRRCLSCDVCQCAATAQPPCF